MISPKKVSAVLVTRGNVPEQIDEIVASIHDAGIHDIVIWDNAQRPIDLACYGRYAGIAEAKNDYIFHQDDDLLSNIPPLLAAYDPTDDHDTIVANNRADEEWRLTAIGSVFHRSLVDGVFDAYTKLHGFDADFCRVCDVVFAYQHPYRKVVLGYRDLATASAPDSSMYLQPDHMRVRERALKRTLALPVRTAA